MNKKVLVLGFNLKTYFCKQFGFKMEENEEYEVFGVPENENFLLYKPHGLRNNYQYADRIRLNNYLSKESSYHQIVIVCQFGRFDQIYFMIREFYEYFSYYFNIVTLVVINADQPRIELEDQLYLNENLISKFNLNTILYFSAIQKQQIQDQICSIIKKQESVHIDIHQLKLQEEQNIDYQLLHYLNQFNNSIQMNIDNEIQQQKSIDTINKEELKKQFLYYGCFY